jgi:2-oxoisovalerate dehydrogenase E1 component
MAGLWRLPVVYLCENNQYGLSASVSESSAVPQLSRRAASYGIPGVTVDGNDVEAVYTAVLEAVSRARRGEGATFIEALTYRWGDHSMRGNLPRYRTQDEERTWIARDPIAHLERLLTGRGIPPETLRSIRDTVEDELSEAEEFAKTSPEPSVSVLESSVYAPHVEAHEPDTPGEREVGFVQALNEALHLEMERDERVVLLGEDVGKIGGIFGVTTGLMDRFGPDRVRDTPISEAGIAGLGVGAALTGMRPVVEVQFFDFVTLMMDMIVNQAAKLRFMLGGTPTVPLVVRGPQGAGIRMAAQHSQCLETWFTQVPGLIVIAPSTPYDATGLLASAIRDDNPVIFLEHKLLYLTAKGPVPEGSYGIPFGKAAVRRLGTDVTIVATQAMVPRAMSAANDLARSGIDAEVIDPRTLWPLDEEAILSSVRKTHRLVIAHEAPVQHGFGAELAALVQEQAFDWLDAPIARVGAPRVPMPYNDALERSVIPSAQRIAEAARRSCEGMGA